MKLYKILVVFYSTQNGRKICLMQYLRDKRIERNSPEDIVFDGENRVLNMLVRLSFQSQ